MNVLFIALNQNLYPFYLNIGLSRERSLLTNIQESTNTLMLQLIYFNNINC